MSDFYRYPAEWELHEACWLAWPSDEALWEEDLLGAQLEFAELCKAITDYDSETKTFKGERLEILVSSPSAHLVAKKVLEGLPVRFHEIPYGDIWLRDTAPLFIEKNDREIVAQIFQFNGWGEKYILKGDQDVGVKIANASKLVSQSIPFILEGGSLETDGLGTCLTSEQCLLNPNRNKGMNIRQVENVLGESLGIKKTIWLKQGLLNDHTDGHIDTLARFVAPGVVICMSPANKEDPNELVLHEIRETLTQSTDAQGKKLKVLEVPSPGPVKDETGSFMPASYMNFYIGNSSVVGPTYGAPNDDKAVQFISDLFPKRKVVGRSARIILEGGGAFHCITQQQPLRRAR